MEHSSNSQPAPAPGGGEHDPGASIERELRALRGRVAACMGRDRARLRRRLRGVAGARDRERALARVRAAVERSAAERRSRLVARPDAPVAPDLPIAAHAQEIEAALRAHQVVIVSGATGSGKTTQLPKICLAAGRGVDGYIGHTQPRRVAARSVAARLAREFGGAVGGAVGCKVRFNDQFSADGYVKVMTDGILLAEIQGDRSLRAYDTIIIDEAHERSLNIDFLLGYVRALLARRPDLRLVVSSATLDVERFSTFFAGAPVVDVSGRSYPIEVRYRPCDGDTDIADAVAEGVAEVVAEGPGDVLVFLSGEREIRAATAAVRRRCGGDLELHPLYARLPLGQQERVFTTGARRRVVLATNVAETSLTVPGVRYVVDTGLARIGRFSHRWSVQRLPIEPVSRASAEQRKGRCGRVAPGICVRLYAEDELLERPEHTAPEILRTDLASVILQLKSLGIDEPGSFDFIDPPDRRHLNDGLRLLGELGALDAGGALTEVGRRLARLPVGPRIGRILLAADELDSLADVLVIAAALGIPDPRERPEGAGPAAAAAHARFRHPRSDFLGLLAVWDFHRKRSRGASPGEVRRLCRRHFLSVNRLREWQDVHDQLRAQCVELGLHRGRRGAGYGRIHKALVAGLWRLVGCRGDKREYRGVRGGTFRLSPASGQHDARPKWVVAAEIVETHQAYAHRVASIRPEWVERSARSLVRRTHFDAHWDGGRGEVMAYEQTSVYDLVLTARRRVRYAPVSRAGAREIFIRSALVEGELVTAGAFLAANRAVVDGLRREEARLRRPGAILNEAALFEFYDGLVPGDVCDARAFEAWRRRRERDDPDSLRVHDESLRRSGAPRAGSDRFPDHAEYSGIVLGLEYRFAPGEPDDGITAVVPLDALGRLRAANLEWLVPGLLEEKVTALLRGLPKALRRAVAPVARHAAAFCTEPARARIGLCEALGHYLRAAVGVVISPQAWAPERLERHLRLGLRVVDEHGAVRGEGLELAELQRRLRRRATAPVAAAGAGGERFGLREWDFDDLPASLERERGGATVTVYPTLVDQADCVALCLVESAAAAREEHARGVRRLFLLGAARELADLRRRVPQADRLGLLYALAPAGPSWWRSAEDGCGAPGTWAELCDAMLVCAAERALDGQAGAVRTREAFAAARARALSRLPAALEGVSALCAEILELHRAIRELRRGPNLHAPESSLHDVDDQLAGLVGAGFLTQIPAARLGEVPRYLRALERRLRKLAAGGARDGERVASVAPHAGRYARRALGHAERGLVDPELERYRWMIEEYRVSLFAQEIGTRAPVSAKRLDAQWARVEP